MHARMSANARSLIRTVHFDKGDRPYWPIAKLTHYSRPMPLFARYVFFQLLLSKFSRHTFTYFLLFIFGQSPSRKNESGLTTTCWGEEEETVLPLAPGLRRAPNPYMARALATSPGFSGRRQQQKVLTDSLVRAILDTFSLLLLG